MGAKGKMLALEISPKVIRAMEYVPGTSPLEVTLAAATDWPGGEPVRVGRFLREFLSSHGFTAKRAVVSYFGPLIEHRIYVLPPATGETRDALLRGKVAEEISTQVSELRVTGEIIGKQVERGVERQEVLAVYIPEFEIRRLVFLLIEAGITPVRVTSVPLALSVMHPKDQADNAVGFLHVDPSRAIIGVSGGGKLRFARDFPADFPQNGSPAPAVPEYHLMDLPAADAPEGDAELSEEETAAERVMTELTRTFLYYRQLTRGGSISQIYWSGTTPSEAMKRLVAERLRLEIAPHPAVAAVVWLRDGLSADPAGFAVPIGLALLGEEPDRVNLLPTEYLGRKERWKNLVAVAVIAFLFLAANAGLYLGLHNAEARYREVLASVTAGTNLNQSTQEEFLRWRNLRQVAREASAGEQALRTPFTRWKPFFARLGMPVPRRMAFTSLGLERDSGGFRAQIKGKIRGETLSEVQDGLNGFLTEVRKGGILSDVEYLPVDIRPIQETKAEKGYEQEFLVRFRLQEEE
jgi:hypothetical protein